MSTHQGPVSTTRPTLPAAPVGTEIPPFAVSLDPKGGTHPVNVQAEGTTYGLTAEEALDLAVELMQVANDARAAAAPRG